MIRWNKLLRMACVLLLAVTGIAGTAVATHYVWTANGDATTWVDQDNWDDPCGTEDCYPKSTADDAKFPFENGGWGDVLLDTLTIDDLTVKGNVDFVGGDTSPVLTVDSFTITAVEGNGDVVITIDGATIAVEQN